MDITNINYFNNNLSWLTQLLDQANHTTFKTVHPF